MIKISLEKIRNELNILTLAKDLGLQVGRRNARCFNSAAHKNNDGNYSLCFDAKRNRFKCFACNCSGSTIDLYAGIKGIEPSVAMRELWNIYFDGKALAAPKMAYSFTPVKELLDVKRLERESTLDKFSEIYTTLMRFCGDMPSDVFSYLKGNERGLTQETISKFGLFYIRDYQETNKFLKEHYSLEELQMSGLVGEKGNLIFYKHRLVIPFTKAGQVVFLQGRRLDSEHPKYLQLSDVEVPLFNMDTIGKHEMIYLCEGVFDAMMLEQNGIGGMAVLGVNNFKEKHAKWIAGFHKKIKVVFDNDDAGKTAADRVLEMLLFEGVNASLGHVPPGYKDVTEYYINLPKVMRAKLLSK